MKDKKTDMTRELGLEAGYLLGKYFLKLDYLHYGYWTPQLEVDIANLHLAQEQYTKFVISHIPDGVKTILDVGCGTGQLAKQLLDLGYIVDCVSPGTSLTKHAAELLGDRSHIFECFYEDLQTNKRYDLVLFCESFQYINPERAMSNTNNLLSGCAGLRPDKNEGGYLLICDIFRKDADGKSRMGGGHKLTKFYELIEKFPFKLIKSVDITEQTAPNMDLFSDVLKNVVEPAVDVGFRYLQNEHPSILQLIRWRYKKQIDKLQDRYIQGGRTGEDFKKHKCYQLLLYRK
jgi:SAM-dependent methyltransferase